VFASSAISRRRFWRNLDPCDAPARAFGSGTIGAGKSGRKLLKISLECNSSAVGKVAAILCCGKDTLWAFESRDVTGLSTVSFT